METRVRVALLIGDIYRDSCLPKPFEKMAGVFEYGNTEDVTTTILTLSGIGVEVTALSTSPYDEYVKNRTEHPRFGYHPGDLQVYREAIRSLVNSPKGPLSHLSRIEPHIVVIGQTPLFEQIARGLASAKETLFDPVIIRFSSFYPDPSAHTGNSAKEVGYGFDMPKDPFALYGVLTDEPFLHSFLSRQTDQLEVALCELNRSKWLRDKPILIV